MPTSTRSPLLIALIAVSIIAIIEGIAIVFLLASGITRPVDVQAGQSPQSGAPTPVVQEVHVSASPTASDIEPTAVAAQPPAGGDLPRGRVGDRIESGGYVLTVVGVYDEPDPDLAIILDLKPDQRYIAAEVLLENRTAESFLYAGSQFRLKDSDDFEYTGDLDYRQPGLELGTMVPGERVRGFLSFVVPKEAAGLSLIYQAPADAGY